MMVGISVQDETKIVALLARGDSYNAIHTETGVSLDTIGKVKKRNKENLDIITQKSLELEHSNAQAIKDKANKMLSKKLDADERNQDVLLQAKEDWLNNVIEFKQYEDILRRHKALSVSELVAVSKEMHAQASTGDSDKTPQADLTALTEAIRNGDTVQLNQMIFNPK